MGQRINGQLLAMVTLQTNISLPISEIFLLSYVLYEQREMKRKHTANNMEEANCLEKFCD